jgi:DNA-directed RNA polymerase specialized sigma24 family protein
MNRILTYSYLCGTLPPEEARERVEWLEERVAFQSWSFPPDPTPHPLEETVNTWITHLPEKDQSLVYAYYGECLSLQDIADGLGTSKQAVHKKIVRLKRQLTDWLAAQGITGCSHTPH